MTGQTTVHFNFYEGLSNRFFHAGHISMTLLAFHFANGRVPAVREINGVFPTVNVAQDPVGGPGQNPVQAINARLYPIDTCPGNLPARFPVLLNLILFGHLVDHLFMTPNTGLYAWNPRPGIILVKGMTDLTSDTILCVFLVIKSDGLFCFSGPSGLSKKNHQEYSAQPTSRKPLEDFIPSLHCLCETTFCASSLNLQ
jgi:hypothetical protein